MGETPQQEGNTVKRADEDQPWIENYPPLRDWIRKHEMRCVHQIPFGGTKAAPEAYLEAWQAPNCAVMVWMVVRSNKHGWDLMTGVSTNSVTETLEDAERRMGLKA